jgi:hypothetical protein
MVYSQIWLIVFPDDRHFDYIIKVEIQKKKNLKNQMSPLSRLTQWDLESLLEGAK